MSAVGEVVDEGLTNLCGGPFELFGCGGFIGAAS